MEHIKWSAEELVEYLSTTQDDIKTRRKIVAENTFEYFKDGSCMDEDTGICSYFPQGKYSGCAIGRLCSPKKGWEGKTIGSLLRTHKGDVPEYLKVLGDIFLYKLQRWHDSKQTRSYYSVLLSRHSEDVTT